MPRKAIYPDWVSRHLKPGQYINKKGDSYYVYAAHSERRKDVPHPVRVSDGYLGRITEKDGFIPARKRGTAPATLSPHLFHPDAWAYGLPVAIYLCSGRILSALRKTYRSHGTFIYICSVQNFLHGFHGEELYQVSVLSLMFPEISFPKETSSETASGIQRGTRMIMEAVERSYSDDWPLMKAFFSTCVLTKSGKGHILPALPPSAAVLAEKYSLPLSKDAAKSFLSEFPK